MASNKDILEAQRFNRRRLVTAFSSGTPRGRELESRSPLRPMIVGAVLVVVMVAAAAVMGRFSPTLPTGWENSTLIVVKGSGARYYTINGVLRPVTNVTSAHLLTQVGSYQVSEVSESTLSGIPRGSQVGLTGVPDDVPGPAALHSDQWTTCAMEQGPHTWVAGSPSGTAPLDVALVANGSNTYVVADGLRHLIDPATSSGVLLALGLDSAPRTEVTATWLDVFEQGSNLTPLVIDGAGTPAAGMPAGLSSAVIGTVIEVEDNAAVRRYVVTGDSTIAPLSDTADRLARVAGAQPVTGNPLRTTVAEIASLTVDPSGAAPADWPAVIGSTAPAGSVPCAQLVLGQSRTSTRLLTMSADDASRAAGSGFGSTAPPDGTAPMPAVTVLGGSGALVRASSGGSLGVIVFISDTGTSHALGEDPADSLARLGWGADDATAIPAPWLALVPEGTAMTADAVWQTVGAL